MKIGILLALEYDIGCGTSEKELATTFNVEQLKSIAKKLNKKFGYSSETESLEFSVRILDTKKIKDSLSKEELSILWR